MSSSAFDTFLHLLNSGGSSVASDDDAGDGTNSLIVFTPSSSGTYTVHCTSYAAGATGAYTVQVTSSGGGGTELLTNGGFDTGAFSPWVASSRASLVTTSSQAGTHNLRMLGVGTSGNGTVYQPVTGFNGTARTLRFYLKVSSAETTTSSQYDRLYVRITNSSNTTLTTLATYSNLQKTTHANWVQVTLTIPATYAVSGNRLRFYATEDVSLQTSFFIDSVSIQ
jgi:hypothetical protein